MKKKLKFLLLFVFCILVMLFWIYSKRSFSFLYISWYFHQTTTCPHASRQNGVAERKLRHFLNVTHTLLIHMHVTKTFWAEVILCACHWINRMPSFVLHDKIPFFVCILTNLSFLLFLMCLILLVLFKIFNLNWIS